MITKKEKPNDQDLLNAVNGIEQFWLKLFKEDMDNIYRFIDLKKIRTNQTTSKTVFLVNRMFQKLTGNSEFVSLKTLDEYGKSSKAQLANWIKGGGPEFNSIMQHAEFIDIAARNLGDKTQLTSTELLNQLKDYTEFLGFEPVSTEELIVEIEEGKNQDKRLFTFLISVYLHTLIAHLDAATSLQLCKPCDQSEIQLKPICLYTTLSKQFHTNNYKNQGNRFVLNSCISPSADFSYPTQNLFRYLTALRQLSDKNSSKKLYGLPDFTADNDPNGFKQTYIKNAKDRKSTLAFLDLLWLSSCDDDCSEFTIKWSELSRADFYRKLFKEAEGLGEGFAQIQKRTTDADERSEDWTVIADHSWLHMIWLVYRFRLLNEQNFEESEFFYNWFLSWYLAITHR